MSDFFMPTQNNQEIKDQEAENYRNAAKNVQNQEIETYKQKKQQHLENWDRYGVNVPDEYYDAFNKIIAQAPTPEEAQEEAYKIGSAVKYSEAMGIPLLEAYQNVDAFNEAQFTDLQGQKGRFEALSDMLNLGRNNVKLGRLGQELMQAHSNNDTELANALMTEIDAINSQNQLMQDNAPRSWVMQALEAGAQSLPFTGVVAGAGIVGNFIAPVAGTGASFAASSYLSAGTEYIDMIANGASPETARLVASVSGGIQGLIEADLGISKSIVKSTARVIGKEAAENAAKKSVEEIGRKVFKRFHFGAGKKVLINYLENRGKDILGEGTEEFLQEITSIVGQEVAASLDGYDIPDDDFKSIVKQTTEAFRGGVLGALSMGFIPAGINAAADVKEYKLIKDTAEVFESEEMFKEAAKDSPVFEGMSDEAKADTIHEVWQRAQNRKEIEAQQIAEGRDAGEGAEEAAAENEDGTTEAQAVARNDAGRLYTSNDVSTDDAGNVTGGTFVIGDKTKSENNRYGYIKYSQDAEGNITIDNFKMTEGREGLRAEAFDDFAREHPDVKIEWNAVGSEMQDAKQALIDANPSGAKNGLNYYSTNELDNVAARKMVAEEVRKNIHNVKRNADGSYTRTELSNKQVAAAVTLIESAARRMGMGLNEYVNKTFGNQIFGTSEEFAQASLAQGEDVTKKAGGMYQGVAQSNWREVGQQIKAVIYAGENADFSTWAHEMAHVFQNQLEGDLKTEAEAAFNVQDGDWIHSTYTFKGGRTMSSAEAFAYGFQDWLETGKAENEQMRNIFQKFAEFIADCYNRLKSHLDFSPEIVDVFNKLLDGDDTIMSKALKAAQEQDNEYRAILKRQAEEKQAQQEAEKEEAKKQAQAEREEAEEGTDFAENAPTAEELLNGIEEAENETKETENGTNAIDNALENTNLTDDQKEQIAETLKDESSTVVEKAEATTKAASSEYHFKPGDIVEFYFPGQGRITGEIIEELSDDYYSVMASTGYTTNVFGKDLKAVDVAPYDLFQNEGALLSQLVGEESIQAMVESQYREEALQDLKKAKMFDRLRAEDPKHPEKKAEFIRNLTGWEKDRYGKWQYETDDSQSRIKVSKAVINQLREDPNFITRITYGKAQRLGDLLSYPELYQIFPDIKKIPVTFYKAADNIPSEISKDGIKINSYLLDGPDGENGLKGRLAHEVQHVIQAYEHAKSAGISTDDLYEIYANMMEDLNDVSIQNDYNEASVDKGFSDYMLNEGEIEARNVARRVLLTANQRREQTIRSTEDVKDAKRGQTLLSQEESPDFLEATKKAQELLRKNKLRRVLFQDERDNEYEEAVRAGDTEKAKQMLQEEAERKGYNLSSDYQGTSAFNGAAPYRNGYYSTKEERLEAVKNEEFEDTATLGDYAYDNADALGFEYLIEDPRAYRSADEKRKEAIDNLRKAVSEARSGKKNVTIKMYRSVPADIKEGSFRNGDWITPSKSYAEDNADVHGWSKDESRIIEQDVDIEHIWWDGNDIAEWGYDDEKEAVYKNTENNRKLFEITYDKNGNLIPLSQRFDESNPSILYQIAGEIGAENLDNSEVQEGVSRMQNLAIAKQMEAEGKDAQSIRLATGWEKGADDKWKWEFEDDYHLKNIKATNEKLERYEKELKEAENNLKNFTENKEKAEHKIKDMVKRGLLPEGTTYETELEKAQEKVHIAQMLLQYDNLLDVEKALKRLIERGIDPTDFWNDMGESFYLPQLIDNPELFRAYPELEKVTIAFARKDIGNHYGSYNPAEKSITIYPTGAKTYTTFKSVLAHEVQHAIQYIEGFAKGGSSEQFKPLMSESDIRMYKDILIGTVKINRRKADEIKDRINKDIDADKLLQNFMPKIQSGEETIESWFDYLETQQMKHPEYDEYKKYKLKENEAEEEADKLGKYQTDSGEWITPEEAYTRLAGEVESRNVQTRIGYTPEQRRNTLLKATEDVAPRDKILLFQSINTAEQMEQTRSDAFKKWFGDWENDPQNASKVVDENGKPMVMYHETGNQFDTFDPRHGGAGNTDYMFPYGIFTKPTDKNIGVARNPIQMPLYVNMKKPLEVYSREDLENYLKNNVPGFKEDLEKLQNTDKEYEAKYDAAEKEYDAAFDDIYENHPEIWEDDAKRIAFGEEAEKPLNRILEEWKGAYAERAKALRNKVDDYFRNSDYDGIILKSDAGSFGRSVSSYVVFDPVQVKSAVNNNGNFDPSNPNILFQIAGEIGAANLDNSEVQEGVSRMQNLAIAKQMEAEGKSDVDIRLATGWEKGDDGYWRYEIPDGVIEIPTEGKEVNNEGKFVPKKQKEGYLREYYKSDELYKAYPDLKYAYLRFVPLDAEGQAYYAGGDKIDVNIKYLNDNDMEGLKKTLVHEIQHIIQRIEGFAKGGSFSKAAQVIEEENQRKAEIKNKAFAWEWKIELEKQEETHPELKGNLALMNSLINDYTENGKYSVKELEEEGWLPNRDIRDKGFNLYVRGYDKAGFEDAYKEWQETASKKGVQYFDSIKDTDRNRYRYYKRFAGEVESRNVEERINYTPEERLLATLKSTEDVWPTDKIILFQTVYYELENEQIVDKLLFQTNAELMKEAQDFDSWQEFMEYCETFHADDEVSPIPGDADAQWYQIFYETANGVKAEQEKNTEAAQAKEKKDTQLPLAMDALFSTFIRTDPQMVDSFLQMVADLDAIDLDSEEWQHVEDEEGAKQRERIEQLKDFINVTLSDYNWQTAMRRVQGGHEISEGLRKRLIGEMVDNFKTRDFRALYAEVTGDEQYAVAPEDSITAVLNKKLRKYHDIVKPGDDISKWSPERRKQLAEQLANREIAAKIKNGSLKLDDELDAYIKSLTKQIKEKQKQFDELEAETKADYQRIADKERRDLLKLHEQLLLARGKLKTRNQEIERKIKKGLKITEKYDYGTQNANADYDEIFRKYSDLRNSIEINAEIQAILDRQEQAAIIREDLNAKQKEKNLTAEIKKMRIQLVKKTMRRVPFNRIDYDNAKTVIAIQRMLEPNLLGGVNRFIGIDSPYLRGVISQIVTDSEFKEKIMNYLSKTAKASQAFADFKKKLENLKSIKDFDSWTAKDRKAAIRYLPKENWVRDLNLMQLAKEREESIDLDIGMEEVKRTVYDEKTGEPKTYKDAQGNEHTVTETAFKLKANEEIERLVQDAVGADMFNKIVNMPFSEWTTEDLEQLAQRIDEIYTEGRDMFAAKNEARKKEAAAIRKRIEDAIKETGITINDDDTPEEKERKRKQIEKILGMSSDLKGTEAGKNKGVKAKLNRLLHSYADMNVLRFARMLDGQSEGENVRMLYRMEDDCYNRKQRSMNARAETVHKVMADNKITEGDLAQTVKAVGTEFTVDELLYFLAADKDYAEDEKKLARGLFGIDANDDYAATSRNAVMFGNMFSDTMSQEEKESWVQLDKDMAEALQNDTLTQEQKEELATGRLDKTPGTSRYIAACHAKWEAVLSVANDYLSTHPEYKALMEAIEADYASQYERMNEVSITEFNQPVHRVKAYVPLVRRESNGETNENQVKEDLLGANGIGKQWADRGMTQRRVNISPLNQKPVQTGLFLTWGNSIERTEHFIAYAPYVRQLNAVYKSRDAAYTRRFIESRYGAGAIKYLDEYINEVANPNAGRIRERGAEWLHVLRGKTAPAYLGWKASAIIKQGLTSPWPYMQFINPAEYTAAALKFTFNPEMREAIKEKSVFMKMRRMDPVNDLIDEMADNAKSKLDRGWSNFSKIGMQGLELIDWACVAPGWLACYEKKYNQLQNASNARYEAKMAELKERNMYADVGTSEYMTPEQMEATARKEITEDIETEAVRYADDCTRQCQPSNRVTDLAPLFKNSSEAMKAFLQFQTSLNVIWQNLRYDMPYAVKNKEFTRIAGTVIGYVCAGIFMNSVMDGIGGDDDDDEMQKLRNIIYYSTTQFTDSIPIMGSEITNTMDQLITGKRGFYGSGTDMTPSATKLLSVLTNAKKGNWQKAAELTAEGIGLFLGAPVSGAKEINKLLGKPLDNGEVDIKTGISDVYGIAGDIIGE